MNFLKKIMPLHFKSPIAVFLREFGKYPLGLVCTHVLRTYIEEGGTVTQKKKEKIYKDVHRSTLDYLNAQYGHIISENKNRYVPGVKPKEAVIWVFWWQGEANAPDIIKRCIASIRRNACGMTVYVIDSENYNEFVTVPSHITQKLTSGIISFTHFSDYYRMALLAAHGGMWIDASLYVKDKLPPEIHDMPIYSVKNPGADITNISNWEWTVGAMAGWKGNTLFCEVEKLLSEYWKTNDRVVDYFLFDYMIRLVVGRCESLQKEMTRIPENNASFMYLQDHLGDPADLYMDKFYEQDTVIYKISWKNVYPQFTTDGKETVYSKWLSDNFL